MVKIIIDLITVCYNVLLQFQSDPFRLHHLQKKEKRLTLSMVKVVSSWYIKHLPRHLMASNNRLRRKLSAQVDGMAVQCNAFCGGGVIHFTKYACRQATRAIRGRAEGPCSRLVSFAFRHSKALRDLIPLIATSVDEI